MRTFFITGVSTGLGRAFAEGALDVGHTVVGTVRSDADAADFEELGKAAHARLLDVTDDLAVQSVVTEVEESLGPIDVLVANAGYGHEGILEESSMDDLRHQFAVNVFGAVATIKAVLPGMRARRTGHIITVTSMGGLITMPGLSFYHGSKFALEGISEALGKEVVGLGIHVTAIAPGGFRTDWAGRSMARTDRTIGDYDEVFGPLRANRLAASGHQLGDPTKAAAALLTIVESPNPPAHLLLGSDAVRLVAAGRHSFDDEALAWTELTRSTDFQDGGNQIRKEG